MAEQKAVVKTAQSMGERLAQIVRFVEEDALGKRVVVSYDADWTKDLSLFLQKKYPELGKYSTAQVKGALKLLLKDMTVEAVAREGFVKA